jgi:hypothetical protein
VTIRSPTRVSPRDDACMYVYDSPIDGVALKLYVDAEVDGMSSPPEDEDEDEAGAESDSSSFH